MSKIELQNVSKYIINKKTKVAIAVLFDVSCTFLDHSINVVLGESGSGKTMLLKSIGGIEQIDNGNIIFDNTDVTNTPPQLRNASYLSQNYCLYPHLTVFENIAYPLTVQKINEEEIKRRVEEMLSLFDISLLAQRKPKELSGGQLQRVALARAIIKRPDVLLLDEPLSNIDEQKRTIYMDELKALQKKLQLTIIYVTHHLREALYLSDQIVIMSNGTIVEVGNQLDLYNNKSSILYQEYCLPLEKLDASNK